MKEKSLLLFTLLTQLAVGAFIALGGLYFIFAWKEGDESASQLTRGAFLGVGLLILLSMLVSLFHLGTPRNAWRALANLGASWLSREILFVLLFAATGCFFAILYWLRLGPGWLRDWLAIFGVVTGLALVYSMSHVYMLRSVPVWNSWFTLFSFFSTVFLLGGLAASLLLASHPLAVSQLQRPLLIWLAAQSFVLLCAQGMLLPLFLDRLSAGSNASQGAAGQVSQRLYWGRLAFITIGIILLGFVLYRLTRPAQPAPDDITGGLLGMGFIVALISETLGRSLFYAMYRRSGL